MLEARRGEARLGLLEERRVRLVTRDLELAESLTLTELSARLDRQRVGRDVTHSGRHHPVDLRHQLALAGHPEHQVRAAPRRFTGGVQGGERSGAIMEASQVLELIVAERLDAHAQASDP